jgi:hypothetical protein
MVPSVKEQNVRGCLEDPSVYASEIHPSSDPNNTPPSIDGGQVLS